jgi:hypothetical protein
VAATLLRRGVLTGDELKDIVNTAAVKIVRD